METDLLQEDAGRQQNPGEPTPTELVYGSEVFARLHTRPDQSLERLDIALGDGFRTGPAGAGVNLTGRTDILLFDEWRDAIAFFTPEPKPARASPGPTPVRAGPRHRPVRTDGSPGAAGAGPGQEAETGFFSTATINIELETGLLNAFNQSFKDSSMQQAGATETGGLPCRERAWKAKCSCPSAHPRKTG